MYFCRRFLGLVLTGLFVASLSASADGPKEFNKYNRSNSQQAKVLVKALPEATDKAVRSLPEVSVRGTRTLPEINQTYRVLPDLGVQSDSRDCTDCEFDFTAYGSECCDSAWDEYGLDCATLEANYSWDCSGCLCPGDGPAECGDGACTGDETYETCPDDCNAPGECDAGFVVDCVDDDCCPESWIGDGFEDCEDQAYGCDLTCYDNDGGDCAASDSCDAEWAACLVSLADYDAANGTTWATECAACEDTCAGNPDVPNLTDECYAAAYNIGAGVCPDPCGGGGSADCEDCEFDFTAYGSECCDTAWVEYGIDCATLEANYSWDCSGCNCPGDGPAVCGDGACTGDETYDTCPEDCNAPGVCDPGFVPDCVDDDCCPESWIGDGFEDCEDQAYGCDLTCYDNDGGDCAGGTTTTTTTGGSDTCTDCEFDFTAYGSECCDTAWDEYGIDCATLEANYSWDCTGCNCPGDGGGFNSDDDVRSDVRQLPVMTKIAEVESREGSPYNPNTGVSINEEYAPETRNDIYVLTFSCELCVDFGDGNGLVDYSGDFSTAASGGEFTVYGFGAGTAVSVTAQSCTNAGACSDVTGPATTTAGAGGEQDCVEGGGDPCDGQAAGDANADGTVNVLDVVSIVNHILAGGNGLEGCDLDVADYNGDETVNVLDVVAIVNLILAGGGRSADATDATMNTTENGVNISANGYIGGVQMTLSHDADFSIELTNDAYIAEYKTDDNTTTLIVINPENEVIFTSTGDFKVEEVLVTNSEEFITVTEVNVEFSLSNAYPNPFNPTTTIELNLSEASYASVKVFNLKGETVGILMDGMVDASTYTMTWDASNLSSGVYMIRAEANGQIATQKVMLVK